MLKKTPLKLVFLCKCIGPVSLVLIVHVLCLKYLHSFHLYGSEGLRLIPFLISPAPVLFCYFILRGIFQPIWASLLVLSVEIILSIAHVNKLEITQRALNWSDITRHQGILIGLKYLSVSHLWVIGLLVVVFLTVVFMSKSRQIFKFSWAPISIALILLPLVCYDRAPQRPSGPFATINAYLREWGLGYYIVSRAENVRLNGLPFHLVQTSHRRLPRKATESQKQNFARLSQALATFNRPPLFILVLCESCWSDKKYFSETMDPLRELGLKEIRSVSPVFGGMTPQAEFELLTGLPVRSQEIQGVFFQEYAELLKPQCETLPKRLKEMGYSTVAIHNFLKKMWNRDMVLSRFGFERFISIEDMNYELTGTWPEDEILFSEALKVIREKRDKPLFLYLMTVASHGPYPEKEQDSGTRSYQTKLKKTIDELAGFLKTVKKENPDYLAVIFGDHKPQLYEFFINQGINPNPYSLKDWEKNGDVPVFIGSSQPFNIKNHLPFFCLSEEIDRNWLRSGLPSYSYTREKSICSAKDPIDYSSQIESYPPWLYSLSFFEELSSEKIAVP